MSCKPLSNQSAQLVGALRSPLTWIVLLLAVLLFTGSLGIARPAVAQNKGDITAEQVRTAIDRGKEFLLRTQNQNGSWPDYGAFPGGVSALCTLALLIPLCRCPIRECNELRLCAANSAGEDYVVACNMVLCMAEPQKDFAAHQTQRDLGSKIAKESPTPIGPAPGLRAATGERRSIEHAIPMLALHEAERIGRPIRQQVWTKRAAILGQKANARRFLELLRRSHYSAGHRQHEPAQA